MKIDALYISSVKPHAGSLIISMGMMQMLKTHFERVAFFRPFIEKKDKIDSDINFMLKYYNLEMNIEETYGFYVDEAEELISNNKIQDLLSKLMQKFKNLQKKYDFVLCEGLNQESFSQSIAIDLNVIVSKNLGTPFISVLNAKDLSIKEIIEELKIDKATLKKMIVNILQVLLIVWIRGCIKSLKRGLKMKAVVLP